MKDNGGVWITGVGLATPLGSDLGEFTANLLAGRCAIRRVTKMAIAGHPSQIAAELVDIPRPQAVDEAVWVKHAPLEQLVLWCMIRALQNGDLWERRQSLPIGVVLGLGAEWPYFWERYWFAWEHERVAPGRPAALQIHKQDCHLPERPLVHRVCEQLGLDGPRVTIAAACASGNYALGLARQWIRSGRVAVCLAGACDLPVTPLSMSCFGNLRALSRRNDQPQAACRPFDRQRDGFVMGEGGAVFVLEAEEHARRRKAEPLAAILGFGASSDASHLVIPNSDPEPAARALRLALADARIGPEDINYLNAHAPGTPVGDRCETRVVQLVFGEAAKRVPVSSTKSMTGHGVTAASALEAAACIGALRAQAIPPTINLDDPDPECDLCHVSREARPARLQIVASNSFGFGGSNTMLILKRVA
ncbi:MAG: beta-ketoacyl-[acyl-carrier-protein] synthase family protein [Gemmatales bacterium]|nr:beta-ketoacyl-[acyl-carrier-protein] synthase family protein [Gemmatales bacterium]MCS7161377.1 beta-ketoacyl-[acyl-carrier-protein] synthase family protein [Gemmatales bacterium]MDW8176580.1 beta-ketoacyl-[acyl-carrier-protein] synthase family protein [Gemmatales bacterium]MDW8223782.1 beta-ketoacyl-[acyl-carrier-protein] synthase family protein [Gemmatales bacterium]